MSEAVKHTPSVGGCAEGVPEVGETPTVSPIDLSSFKLVEGREPVRTDLWLPFADGLYHFALPSAQLSELERECSIANSKGEREPTPVGTIYGNLAQGRALLPGGAADWTRLSTAAATLSAIVERDCFAVIRLGLIGGGEGEVNGARVKVDQNRARSLLSAYVEGQPLEDAWHYAFAILGARICGVPVARSPDAGSAATPPNSTDEDA